MAKIAFKDVNFRANTLAIIATANKIITDYTRQGFKLTLRQLYYQFITRNVFPNSERSYKKLASVISDARYAGLVDWDAIEDRGRVIAGAHGRYYTMKDGLRWQAEGYRLPIWEWQPAYVELWVEKQALAGVLEVSMAAHRIPLMVNKGYSSSSAMFDAAMRIKRHRRTRGGDTRSCTVLYLGDHDPSGEDMVRDIDERFTTFGVHVNVKKIALTRDQVDEYEPPPNPAKTSDSRYEKYAEKHGDESWEVDALNPAVMHALIDSEIDKLKDQEEWDRILKLEEDIQRETVHAINKMKIPEVDI